jgi:hypothetical protein
VQAEEGGEGEGAEPEAEAEADAENDDAADGEGGRRRLQSTINQGYIIQDVGCKKQQMKVYFENNGAGSQVW